MALAWSNGLSVGVKLIDHQHQELITRVNRMFDAMRRGKGTAEVVGAVKFLEAYAIAHFEAEEELMNEHDYPDMQKHVEEHDYFRKEVVGLRKQYNEGADSAAILNSARTLCVAWFTHHIENIDSALGRFLKERGIKG